MRLGTLLDATFSSGMYMCESGKLRYSMDAIAAGKLNWESPKTRGGAKLDPNIL